MVDLDLLRWQLCEEKTTVSEETFLMMITKAKEDLKTRQQQMALQEREKQQKLVCIESRPVTYPVSGTLGACLILKLHKVFKKSPILKHKPNLISN